MTRLAPRGCLLPAADRAPHRPVGRGRPSLRALDALHRVRRPPPHRADRGRTYGRWRAQGAVALDFVHEAAHLSSDQLRAVLEQASTSRYASIFELLARIGMRRGEALALRWTDVDFTDILLRVRGSLARVDGTLTVTAPKTTHSARFIPISADVESLLRQVKASQATERLQAGSVWTQTGFVFTTETGQPCDPRNALRALKAASARAGLPSTTLHTIRHSAATLMLVNGVPLKVVSDVLGHASVAITGDVYGHVSPDVSRTALAALSTALET